MSKDVNVTWKWAVGVLATLVITLVSAAVFDMRAATQQNTTAISTLLRVTAEMAMDLRVRVAHADKLHEQMAATDERLTKTVDDLRLLLAQHLARTDGSGRP